MVEKISDNIGEKTGMTREEILEHLDLLKTEESKIKYLQMVMLKQELLDENTKIEIEGIIKNWLKPKIDESVGWLSSKDYEKIGTDKNKLIEAARFWEEDAANDIAKNADYDQGIGHYIDAIKLYHKAGEDDLANNLAEKVAKIVTNYDELLLEEIGGKFVYKRGDLTIRDKALQDIFMELGRADLIVKYFSPFILPNGRVANKRAIDAADNLEKAGYILQAKKIREKIERITEQQK